MKTIKMMKVLLVLQLLLILCAITMLQACDDQSESPNQTEQFLKQLQGTWTLTGGAVTADGIDITAAFPGFTITFYENKSYAVARSVAPLWPASGSYSINENGMEFNIIRDDNVLVAIKSLRDDELLFEMQYTSSEGRIKSLSGQYIFRMTR
jgi:hypothetical protein